jgi:NAD(P)H-dependent FMN reductase
MKLHVIAGTTRPNRHSLHVAEWIAEIAKARPELEVTIIDLAEINLPLYDEPAPAAMGQYTKEHTKRWSAIVDEADAFIFVTAEYNHSIPAVLKNAIDFLANEWANKAAGFVSYGFGGGLLAVEHLRGVAANLRLADVRSQVSFNMITDFENYQTLQPKPYHEQAANALIDDIIAWGTALAPLRAKAE